MNYKHINYRCREIAMYAAFYNIMFLHNLISASKYRKTIFMEVLDFISYRGWMLIAEIPADHRTFKKC